MIRMILPALVFSVVANEASAGTIVPGTANPWLAGMPDGSTLGSDAAPAQSPAEVMGLPIIPGHILNFSATGKVHYGPTTVFGPGPDGSGSGYHDPSNGISAVYAPFNALLGVFLGPTQPNLSPAPAGLAFNSAASVNYSTLSPLLKQVFFIGDGLTSTSVQQQIVVPVGATRLFLGAMDGSGWFNNAGSFEVTVTDTSAVPEPSSLLLALGGMALVPVLRLRARNPHSGANSSSHT